MSRVKSALSGSFLAQPMARRFGVGQTAAGLVISAFAFMRLVFGPAAGALVNRLGERTIMSTGIGIVAPPALTIIAVRVRVGASIG